MAASLAGMFLCMPLAVFGHAATAQCEMGNSVGSACARAAAGEDEGISALQVERGGPQQENAARALTAILPPHYLEDVIGTVTQGTINRMIRKAFEWMDAPEGFEKSVGPFGLPISFAVINDTPDPVEYITFDLPDGLSWGFPAVGSTIQPGEMIQWFLYTEISEKVEATMTFTSGSKMWTIAVAQYRLGHWFTGCDRMRCNAILGLDTTSALEGLCYSYGGPHGAGIRREGDYKLTVLLNAVLQRQAIAPEQPHQLQDLPLAASSAAIEGKSTQATVITNAAGIIDSNVINRAFSYFEGVRPFQQAVGDAGLPLTVGVINDTPEPVRYVDFQLGDGIAWSYPALKNIMRPGEMMQWFLFTHTSGVEATMMLEDDGGERWSLGVAHYRYSNMFSGCSALRSKAVRSASMAEALVSLCKADGRNPRAIHVQRGYQLLILLSEIAAS